MDLFSRKITAWHISGKTDVDFARTTFLKAYKNEILLMGLCFIQTEVFNILLFAFVSYWIPLMLYSLFQKRYPFDNAVCECFFKYLKKEETNRRTYHTLQDLQNFIFEYIEGFYNSKRPRHLLGLLTPNEIEYLY